VVGEIKLNLKTNWRKRKMAKKSIITGILVNKNAVFNFGAVSFRVGMCPSKADGDPVEEMPNVKSIKFARHAYGQGAAVDEPCYIVAFEDSNEVVIIPAHQRVQIMIANIEPDTEQAAPELPE
jgi:hypothetical protein